MASKILAKTKLKELTQQKLRELITQQEAEGANFLLQSHYHVAGSLEEHLGIVRTAFRKWTNEVPANEAYRWSYILGILADSIIFYSSDWYTDSYSYYKLAYSVAADGAVTFEGIPVAVDAQIVIKALGAVTDATDNDDDDADDMAQGQKTKMNITQDAVPTGTPVIDAAKSADATIAAPTVIGGTESTDANTSAPAVPDPTSEADSEQDATLKPPKAGKGDDAGEGDSIIKKEANKTEAGFKQSEFVSLSIDKARKMHLGCITQSEEEVVDGKKHLHITAIVTRGNIINSQGQFYSTNLWKKQLDNMNEQAQAGKFIGRVEHQAEKGLTDTALKFNKFWLQGDDVYADITVVPTIPYGLNLQAMIEAGVQVDFSTVGYGSSTKGKKLGQDVSIINEDEFVCHRIDAVWHASSEGSTTIDTYIQSAEENTKTMNTQAGSSTQTTSTAQERVDALAFASKLNAAKGALLVQAATKLSPIGLKSLEKALEQANDAADFCTVEDTMLPLLEQTFAKTADDKELTQSAAVSYAPKYYVAQAKEDTAPQTCGQLIERLIADVPDTWPHLQGATPGLGYDKNSVLHSQKAAMRQLMHNMARSRYQGFDGPAAIRSLLALEQGRVDYAKDILEQSLATGSTVTGGGTTYASNPDPGAAPLSTPLIFPLVRRVFPQYIMNDIAAIQTMDRPDGKIFYLDARRVVDGTDANDPYQYLNTSANPFSTSFADNNTEGSAPAMIRLELQSITVRATNKKLRAQWSVEEMQDLRAYHNLDAAQELMGATAREMALEWNLICLNDMLANATGSTRTFGGQAPANFTQKDWDQYFWNYIQAVENDIFKKRNGNATHIVMGTDAALAASKSLLFTVDVNSADTRNMDIYPGTTFYPMMTTPSGMRLRIIKTNFWTGLNASKILVIRRGQDWSDTPYVFAPYADYVTPTWTNPGDFSQQQGILSRAARQTVVGDAMGVLTVSQNATGVPL